MKTKTINLLSFITSLCFIMWLISINKPFLLFLFPLYFLIIKKIFTTFFISGFKLQSLSVLLNFPLFYQIIMQLIGQIYLYLRYYLGKFPSVDNYQPTTIFMLPFTNSWYIANGGVDIETSHSWDIYNQRYAYDFIILDSNKKSFHTNENMIDNYYCFSQNIIAPANGKVVKVYNKIDDFKNVGSDKVDEETHDIRGNFIIIKHAKNEYSLLAHLMKDSILVKKNEQVNAGQIIAKCGNSGNSTEPHLHFQIQNGKSFYFSVGLPILFQKFIITKDGFSATQIEPSYITKEFSVRTCS